MVGALLVSLSLTQAGAAPGTPDLAELLKRLAAHDQRMEAAAEAVVTTVRGEVTERDEDGKVTHVTRTVSQVLNKAGKRTTRVVSATKDGADHLEQARKDAAKQDGKNERMSSPFTAKEQGKYRFAVVGTDAKSGLLRVEFAPKGDADAKVLRGEALADVAAGEVVQMTARPSENPSYVKRMDMKIEFKPTPWGRLASAMSFDFAGGLLLWKRQGTASMTFEYAPVPVP